MNALNNTFAPIISKALFSIALLGLPFLGMAQDGWTESFNWKSTFQKTMGAQTNSTWMLDQCADADNLFESVDGKSFAIVSSNDFEDVEELLEEMDAPIVDGSRTHLLPLGKSQNLGNQTYREEFTGKIANQNVRLVCISQWSAQGEGKTVLMVFTGEVMNSAPVMEANAFALEMIGNASEMEALSSK